MDPALYYDDYWRKRAGRLNSDQEFRRKVQLLLEMIPPGVHSILDVGCGDGSITNELVGNHQVTGSDVSPVALEQLDPRAKRVVASASALPFDDGSFDLVFSSELLEHLDRGSLSRAIHEFNRLARKYLLISVQNNEKLRKRYACCNTCGREFHIYGHLHSFTVIKLQKLLPKWKLLDSRVCGHPDAPSLDCVSWMRNRIAGRYFNLAEMNCHYCGHGLVTNQMNLIQLVIDFFLRVLQKAILVILRRKAEPDWLLALFSRKD